MAVKNSLVSWNVFAFFAVLMSLYRYFLFFFYFQLSIFKILFPLIFFNFFLFQKALYNSNVLTYYLLSLPLIHIIIVLLKSKNSYLGSFCWGVCKSCCYQGFLSIIAETLGKIKSQMFYTVYEISRCSFLTTERNSSNEPVQPSQCCHLLHLLCCEGWTVVSHEAFEWR